MAASVLSRRRANHQRVRAECAARCASAGQDTRSQSGFTLIEILLVITLIALSIAMIAPSFVSVSEADIDEEARRLQQVLRLASEEAQLTGIPTRLTALKGGYHFERLNSENAWSRFAESPFNSHSLSQGAEIVAIHFSGGVSSKRALEKEVKEEGEGQGRDEKERIGRLIFWPDGMLDMADIVIGNPDVDRTISLQVRSGPGGIRVIGEGS